MSFFKEMADAWRAGWNEGMNGLEEGIDLVQDEKGNYVPAQPMSFIGRAWWYFKRVCRGIRNVLQRLFKASLVKSIAYLAIGYVVMNPLFIFIASLLIVPIATVSVGLANFAMFVWALFCSLIGIGSYLAGAMFMVQFVITFVSIALGHKRYAYARA
jgi:hypothetical protein